MKKKFLSLETYRAFAALMIAAIHFDLNSPLVDHKLASGHFVQFFFTLSGFVIFYNYNDKITNFGNFFTFVKKRFFRLYPLHLFFLIVFLLIELLKFILTKYYGLDINSEIFEKNNFFSFISNIFLLHTFLEDYTFNTPSWSISAEFYTYILFAFLIIFSSRYLLIFSVIILIYLFRINDGVNFGASHSAYRSFLDCIYGFYWGIIFCKLYILYKKKTFYLKYKELITLLFIIITFFSIINFTGPELFSLPIIFGILIFFSCEVDTGSYLGKIICNKFFVYLGSISYSIYMSHLFVFWIINNSMKYVFKFNTFIDDDNFSKLDLNSWESSFLVLFCYIITIIFSNFSYKYIEKKFYY